MQQINTEIDKYGRRYLGWLTSGLNAVIAKRDLRAIISFIRRIFNPQNKEIVALHQLREESSRLAIIRTLKNNLPNHI
jgi:hypothetical protein